MAMLNQETVLTTEDGLSKLRPPTEVPAGGTTTYTEIVEQPGTVQSNTLLEEKRRRIFEKESELEIQPPSEQKPIIIPPIPDITDIGTLSLGEGRRAASINDVYEIIGLTDEYTYNYSVGLPVVGRRSFTIKNKSTTNPIYIQLILPLFLSSNGTEFIIPPRGTQEIQLEVREHGALNVVYQGKYNYSEPMDVYVNVLDVTEPVLVSD